MSKAFVKDDDPGEDDVATPLEELNPLPAGEPNYITRRGFKKFQAELADLEKQIDSGDEHKRKLRFTTRALQEAKVIDPPVEPIARVVFGTAVTVSNEEGDKRTYAIVGVFEANPKLNKISYLSPLAKALLGARPGDSVTFRLPAGETELEILTISAAD